MIDKRIGLRVKEQREAIGMTQEELAEKLGVSSNYISTIERGASFPRCERLILLLNGLQTSADTIFCDVLDYTNESRSCLLWEKISSLSSDEQKRILNMLELMVKQAESNK
mgnify:CR=1 FL=1|jgi:transcriptional regulator with XRE-family HTH domain